MPHILLTGGSGFLGRDIIRALSEKHPDWRITVLDLLPPPASLTPLISAFIPCDITSATSVNSAFSTASTPTPISVVIHSAGIVPAREKRYSTSPTQWQHVRAINYTGTQNILHATLTHNCTRIVYTSSCTAIIDDLAHDYHLVRETFPLGRATLHYGKSKALAETYILSPTHAARGLRACAIRPTTILGEGDSAVIPLMHDLIAKGETHFILGDGHNLYDFMYIRNASLAHVLAAENLLDPFSTNPHGESAAGKAFFVSNDEPVYFWDFLAFVWAQFGHVPGWRVGVPIAVAWWVCWVLEAWSWVTGGNVTLDRGSVRDGVRTHYADVGEARRVLGWKPVVGLQEGVRRACADYKNVLALKTQSDRKAA